MRRLLAAPALALLLVPRRRPRRRRADRSHLLPADRQDERHGLGQRLHARAAVLRAARRHGADGRPRRDRRRRRDARRLRPADAGRRRAGAHVHRAGRLRRADRQLDVHRHASEGELHAVLGRPQEAARALLGRRLRPRHAQPRRLRALHRAGRQAQADDPARQGDRPVRPHRPDRQAPALPLRRARARQVAAAVRHDQVLHQGRDGQQVPVLLGGRVPAAPGRAEAEQERAVPAAGPVRRRGR